MAMGALGHDQDTQMPTARTAKWLVLLSFIPVLGILVFAGAAALAMRAFTHNNSLSCSSFGSSTLSVGGCSHYSYLPAVALGVVALLLTMGGGAFASYYAMRSVGLPLLSALTSRRASR